MIVILNDGQKAQMLALANQQEMTFSVCECGCADQGLRRNLEGDCRRGAKGWTRARVVNIHPTSMPWTANCL